VILRNLLHTGLKLVVSSVAFGTLVTVTGVSGGWTNWVFSSLFLSGLADMFIAGMFNYAALMSPGADSRVAVEVENGSFRIWVGDDAQERRRRYLEDRERGAYGSWPPDSALRWRREAVRPLPAMRPPEKRLAGPPPRRSFPGIEFQESPAYVRNDRYGSRTPPFPVHFRTLPGAHELIEGARMAPAVMEYHADSRNPGCPVCETWEREWGVFHD
jgi:hypothetical protein